MKQNRRSNFGRWIVWGILLVGVLSLFLYASKSDQDIRSRAAYVQPVSTLLPPWVRLATVKNSFSSSTPIPVSVLVHTNSKATLETYIVLSFDSDILTITSDDVTSTNVYPVVNVESIVDGKLAMSLFTTTQSGYQPIASSKEVEIATLYFHPKKPGETMINVVTGEDQTGLFAATGGEQPLNILVSSEGVTVRIE